MKLNKIYIGGGLTSDQLLWIIPILESFYKYKITHLIFENLEIKKIQKSLMIKNILKKYIIVNKNEIFPIYFQNNIIRYIYVLIYYFPLIIFLSIYVTQKKILNINIKKSWFVSQIFHSIWDTSLSMCSDNQIKPNFFIKLLACLKCAHSYFLAKKLKKIGINYVILGHSVYNYRTMLAYFRKENIPVISQAAYNLHKQKKYKDTHWSEISIHDFIKFKKKIHISKINHYFGNRIIGKGSYLDSINAFKKKSANFYMNYNIIFLHVFKDSPFNVIDRQRIFVDYFDWIKSTLENIKYSKENWLLRLHPSHERWGEDQRKIINKLIKNTFKVCVPNNIFIEEKQSSNIDLFKNAKKIITFNGTVEVEAACFGIKPIVISSDFLKRIDKSMVFKPNNKENYFKLINAKNKNIFKLKPKQVENAKLLLFLREEVFYLKKEFDGNEIYRSDTNKIKTANFNKILKKIDKKKNYLKKLGVYLAKYNRQTMRQKYIDYING